MDQLIFRPEKISSQYFRNANRTFFIDLHKTGHGKNYLKLTRSDLREGQKSLRNEIIFFEEDLEMFVEGLIMVLRYVRPECLERMRY